MGQKQRSEQEAEERQEPVQHLCNYLEEAGIHKADVLILICSLRTLLILLVAEEHMMRLSQHPGCRPNGWNDSLLLARSVNNT